MIRALGFSAAVLVIVGRDVHFAANDGLYAMRHRLMVEIGGCEEISVICDGNGRHSPASSLGSEFSDFAGAVEKRVVGVEMEMNKVRSRHAASILNQLRGLGHLHYAR